MPIFPIESCTILNLIFAFLYTLCITPTNRTQRKVSGSMKVKCMKLVAGHVCPMSENSVFKVWTKFSVTIGTHLISNAVWIHVTLLGHSGTEGAESSILTLLKVVMKSPLYVRLKKSCYLINCYIDYHTGNDSKKSNLYLTQISLG